METHKMQLVDWLDDLCVRFIINLPQEELESVARICFQIEEAQWFYEDFIRPIDPSLPSMNLKQFSLKILSHCPLTSGFSDEQHLAAYQEFLGYKTRVPVRGAIMLTPEMDHVLLVKGWSKSASWSFPRGKINKDEDDLDCAVREVWEETGFDIKEAGLVPDRDSVKAIDITMRDQNMRLFVFRNVPMNTLFEPKTRKEISKIQWYRLNDLPTLKRNKQGHQSDGGEAYNPNRFYMVAPFLQPLKKWIVKQRKMDLLHEDEVEDMPSEAYVEEQTHELDTSKIAAHDPTSALKRLLSIPAMDLAPGALQPPQLATNQQQASQLLAMLNGSAGGSTQQNQPQNSGAPMTPMDQIFESPHEPQRPHVSHVQESPFARAQPPPRFFDNQLREQPQAPLSQNPAFQSQFVGLSDRSQLLQMFQQARPVQSNGGHAQTAQQDQREFSQGYAAPSQHNPVAPPSSSLPPPRLNNHAMNMLSTFKNVPVSIKPTPNAALMQTVRQNPPPRNLHQNSLLDLFRSPADAAEPAVIIPEPAAAPAVTTTLQTGGDVSTSRPLASPQRKVSAVSMITRTLPRMKIGEQRPVILGPSLDNDNFPTLGSTPPATKAKPGMTASNIAVPADGPSQSTRIMSHPGPRAERSSRPQSRGKPSISPQPRTILQRPGSAVKSSPSPNLEQQAVPIASIPSPGLGFVPQILKRGQPTPLSGILQQGAESTPSPPATTAPAQSQRSALLSLFAQSQPTKQSPSHTPPIVSPTSSFGPPSGFVSPQVLGRSASQAHGAIGAEASRVKSGTSVSGQSRQGSVGPASVRHASLGSGETGPKSPATPVEARGFLMDYLDGVVKGGK